MREKRRLVTVLVVVGLLCAALVAYAQFFHKTPADNAPTGNAKPLTLRAAANQLRLDLPEETRLEYGELVTLADDWAVAARFTFSVDKLADFLTQNGLRPVDGLRVVPTHSGAAVRDIPTDTGGSPSLGASVDPLDPESVDPSPLGSVLKDDKGWLPERAGNVTGIDRNVKEGVARWFLFDMDDTATVTMYVYATPEERVVATPKTPTSSRTPSKSPSATKT